MGKVTWVWTILAGLLLARMGYNEIHAPETSAPELIATVLLTAGLLLSLIGATGALGLLSWLPGMPEK